MRKFISLYLLSNSLLLALSVHTYEVKNLACVSCYETIMGAMSEIKEVKDSQIDIASKTLTIKTDDKFDIQTIPKALKELGYEAIYKGSKIEKN